MQPGKRVAAGEIGDGAVLRITDYVCSAVAGKQRMVISGVLSGLNLPVRSMATQG